MEIDQFGFSSKMGLDLGVPPSLDREEAAEQVRKASPHCRIGSGGWPTACSRHVESGVIHPTKIDPWFLEQIREIVDFESKIVAERGIIGTAGLRTGTPPGSQTIGLCG